MQPYKITFIVDEAAVNTFQSEHALLYLFRNLMRDHEQMTLFVARDGTPEELCAQIDDADAVFCYLLGNSNASSAVRSAEAQGKTVLHLESRFGQMLSRPEILFFD